ncbi:MAG: Uma2 family endonuclease [Planctomycetota bacterium]
MQLIIDLPSREVSLATHRRRWSEVVADSRWYNCRERIETNALGQIIMTPPPAEWHSDRQGQLVYQLQHRLGGRAKPECPVVTSDGVKAVDVGWYSEARHPIVSGQLACEVAPDICVEVLSPSNTDSEIQNKFRLYFEAGAVECWICDLEGGMIYYANDDVERAAESSTLCPQFPKVIR